MRVLLVLVGLLGWEIAVGTEPRAQGIYFDDKIEWINVAVNKKFRIYKEDEVKDGCWTDTKLPVNAISLELIRSGFEIVSGDDLAPYIRLHLLGYKLDDFSCVVSMRFSAHAKISKRYFVSNEIELFDAYFTEFWSSTIVMSGAKSLMNHRIEQNFQSIARNFLVEYHSKKRILQEYIETAPNSDIVNKLSAIVAKW